MKKSEIIFFELVLIILLFAYTTGAAALETYTVGENGAHVAWDPAPRPPNIPEDSEIRYCVYICKSESKDKKEAVPVKKTVKNREFKAETPIADTSCTIEIPPTGNVFYIGVQTVVYVKEKPVVCDQKIINTENRSDIAWSDKNIYTNNHPFNVYGQR